MGEIIIPCDENKSGKSRLSSAKSTFRILAIDRFVLTHFFLIFFVSFAIGILFLHSTLTLWQWQTNEEALIMTLESATHGLDLSKMSDTQPKIPLDQVLTVSIQNNTFKTLVR